MNENLQGKAFPKHTGRSQGYKEADVDVSAGSICYVSYFGLFRKAKLNKINQGQRKRGRIMPYFAVCDMSIGDGSRHSGKINNKKKESF